jgi:hypothetical protein
MGRVERAREQAEAAEKRFRAEAAAAKEAALEHAAVAARETRVREEAESRIAYEEEAGKQAQQQMLDSRWQLARAEQLLKSTSEAAEQNAHDAAELEKKLEAERETVAAEVARREELERQHKMELSNQEESAFDGMRGVEQEAEMAVRVAAENTRQVMFERQARGKAEDSAKAENLARQMAEQRTREAEWALEKAEQLLKAHEETAEFYLNRAREEASLAAQASCFNQRAQLTRPTDTQLADRPRRSATQRRAPPPTWRRRPG